MPHFANFTYFLFAQANNGAGGGRMDIMLPFLAICAVFVMFFIMSIPQKRERKRWNDMVETLKKNDRVLMSSGIIGKVHSVQKDKNEIIVKIDDDSNTKMTFSLAAVARVLEQPSKES